MSWKKGDYFGSSGLPIAERKVPVVTLISRQGERTVFCFNNAHFYQEFMSWVMWSVMDTHEMTITKTQFDFDEHERKRGQAETDRYNAFMSDFRAFRNGYDYFD